MDFVWSLLGWKTNEPADIPVVTSHRYKLSQRPFAIGGFAHVYSASVRRSLLSFDTQDLDPVAIKVSACSVPPLRRRFSAASSSKEAKEAKKQGKEEGEGSKHGRKEETEKAVATVISRLRKKKLLVPLRRLSKARMLSQASAGKEKKKGGGGGGLASGKVEAVEDEEGEKEIEEREELEVEVEGEVKSLLSAVKEEEEVEGLDIGKTSAISNQYSVQGEAVNGKEERQSNAEESGAIVNLQVEEEGQEKSGEEEEEVETEEKVEEVEEAIEKLNKEIGAEETKEKVEEGQSGPQGGQIPLEEGEKEEVITEEQQETSTTKAEEEGVKETNDEEGEGKVEEEEGKTSQVVLTSQEGSGGLDSLKEGEDEESALQHGGQTSTVLDRKEDEDEEVKGEGAQETTVQIEIGQQKLEADERRNTLSQGEKDPFLTATAEGVGEDEEGEDGLETGKKEEEAEQKEDLSQNQEEGGDLNFGSEVGEKTGKRKSQHEVNEEEQGEEFEPTRVEQLEETVQPEFQVVEVGLDDAESETLKESAQEGKEETQEGAEKSVEKERRGATGEEQLPAKQHAVSSSEEKEGQAEDDDEEEEAKDGDVELQKEEETDSKGGEEASESLDLKEEQTASFEKVEETKETLSVKEEGETKELEVEHDGGMIKKETQVVAEIAREESETVQTAKEEDDEFESIHQEAEDSTDEEEVESVQSDHIEEEETVKGTESAGVLLQASESESVQLHVVLSAETNVIQKEEARTTSPIVLEEDTLRSEEEGEKVKAVAGESVLQQEATKTVVPQGQDGEEARGENVVTDREEEEEKEDLSGEEASGQGLQKAIEAGEAMGDTLKQASLDAGRGNVTEQGGEVSVTKLQASVNTDKTKASEKREVESEETTEEKDDDHEDKHVVGTGVLSQKRQESALVEEGEVITELPTVSYKLVKLEIELLKEVQECENVIKMIEAFRMQEEGGLYFVYLVMEMMKCSLDDLRYHLRPGLLHMEIILRDVLSGISFIHSKDIVHCDIKAENVLLGEDGSVKICDFGLASRLDEYSKQASLTKDGRKGTVQYMAPELLLPKGSGDLFDASVDLWSFGILMYFVVHGRTPFENAEVQHFATFNWFSYQVSNEEYYTMLLEQDLAYDQTRSRRSIKRYQKAHDALKRCLVPYPKSGPPNVPIRRRDALTRASVEELMGTEFFAHSARVNKINSDAAIVRLIEEFVKAKALHMQEFEARKRLDL